MRRYLIVALIASCTPSYTFTASSNRTFISKGDGCPVEAVTGTPTRNYEELGTLQVYSGNAPKDLDTFKRAVAKQVCMAGGDAAIAVADNAGRLSTGSVIKYVGPMAEPLKKVDTPPPQAQDTEDPIKQAKPAKKVVSPPPAKDTNQAKDSEDPIK